jgi:hypothetical protein
MMKMKGILGEMARSYADPIRRYMARRSNAPETVKISAVWYHRFDVPYRQLMNHIDRDEGISTAWFFTDGVME